MQEGGSSRDNGERCMRAASQGDGEEEGKENNSEPFTDRPFL